MLQAKCRDHPEAIREIDRIFRSNAAAERAFREKAEAGAPCDATGPPARSAEAVARRLTEVRLVL
jgi:hypothetical protein